MGYKYKIGSFKNQTSLELTDDFMRKLGQTEEIVFNNKKETEFQAYRHKARNLSDAKRAPHKVIPTNMLEQFEKTIRPSLVTRPTMRDVNTHSSDNGISRGFENFVRCHVTQ